MTNRSTNKRGRPSVRIDQALVRKLREDLQLTQTGLAELVHQKESAAPGQKAKEMPDPDVLKTKGHRWECRGTIPPTLVAHLAAVLGTTVQILTGELPLPAPSRVEDLMKRLQQRSAEGACPELNSLLRDYQQHGDDDPIQALAADISRDWAWVQVTQDPEELDRIKRLTGLSDAEIRIAHSHGGTWLLTGSGPLGQPHTELLHGMQQVVNQVRTELDKFRKKCDGSDAQVAFKKTNQWFTVTCTHPTHKQLTSVLRFARCQATEKGLMWTKAAKEDEEQFLGLMRSAYSQFNFVSDMDANLVPGNVMHLRLLLEVVQNDAGKHASANTRLRTVKTFAGDLKRLPNRTLATFRKDGQEHSIAVDRLTQNLWSYVAPHLSQWPVECWSLHPAQGHISILLDRTPTKMLKANGPLPQLGKYFTLHLVEQMEDGSQRPAPWAEDSVKKVFDGLQQALTAAKRAAKASQ